MANFLEYLTKDLNLQPEKGKHMSLTYVASLYEEQKMIKLQSSKYDKEIFDKCYTGKSNICNGYDKLLTKSKIPMQVSVNNSLLSPRNEDLNHLCILEIM